jgi:predicted RNase H-like HicB family nuclease
MFTEGVKYIYMATVSKQHFSIKIPVSFFREDEYFIAYSPILDISTSAKTLDQAKKRFEELIIIFFEEIKAKGTLEKVLTEMGWKKIQKAWSPPIISNESMTVRIPALN